MKSLPTLEIKQVFRCERKRLGSGEIQFFCPNIFKIKEKFSINFSVASQYGQLNSSKYQNKGQRTYP